MRDLVTIQVPLVQLISHSKSTPKCTFVKTVSTRDNSKQNICLLFTQTQPTITHTYMNFICQQVALHVITQR